MNFKTAVKTCLGVKYFDFKGRAIRSEYWYFLLFYCIVYFVLTLIASFISPTLGNILSVIIWLAFLFPWFGVCVRRLHDVNRCGWWLLIGLIPLVGGLVLLLWFISRGTVGPNKYGPDPLQN